MDRDVSGLDDVPDEDATDLTNLGRTKVSVITVHDVTSGTGVLIGNDEFELGEPDDAGGGGERV